MPAGRNPGRAVHMMDIHAERGLQCADCHFSQDSHGNGFIYGEVANAIEIGCRDCHGTRARTMPICAPPARPRRPHGTNLEVIRNEDGRRRFEWMDCELAREEVTDIRCAAGQRVLIQRSIVDPSLSWVVQPGPRQRRSRLAAIATPTPRPRAPAPASTSARPAPS